MKSVCGTDISDSEQDHMGHRHNRRRSRPRRHHRRMNRSNSRASSTSSSSSPSSSPDLRIAAMTNTPTYSPQFQIQNMTKAQGFTTSANPDEIPRDQSCQWQGQAEAWRNHYEPKYIDTIAGGWERSSSGFQKYREMDESGGGRIGRANYNAAEAAVRFLFDGETDFVDAPY